MKRGFISPNRKTHDGSWLSSAVVSCLCLIEWIVRNIGRYRHSRHVTVLGGASGTRKLKAGETVLVNGRDQYSQAFSPCRLPVSWREEGHRDGLA